MSEASNTEEKINEPQPEQVQEQAQKEQHVHKEPAGQKDSQQEEAPEVLNEKFIQANMELAQKLKQEGNEAFKGQEHLEAITKYREALQYTPEEQAKLRAILYSNIGICLSKKQAYKEAAGYCQKAIACDPSYLKAQLNLANYYEKADKLDEALTQNKKLLEINPKDVKVIVKIKELQKAVQERNEKQKKEVIDGLKNIGNSVLGFFGMSLDNFKMEKGANGGYSVSFKQ